MIGHFAQNLPTNQIFNVFSDESMVRLVTCEAAVRAALTPLSVVEFGKDGCRVSVQRAARNTQSGEEIITDTPVVDKRAWPATRQESASAVT